MVGLVIVSHSAVLAEGVRELALQMTQGRVRIALAGGVDDAEHPIGTDPTRVMAALEEVQDGDGVLVLMDLGSALMSAETALDLLPPEVTANVRLSAAPLIEGCIAAAVQAAAGASLDDVQAEAESALAAKSAQLGSAVPDMAASSAGAAGAVPDAAAEHVRTLAVTVPNRLGLHARPASRIVGALAGLDADVRLAHGGHVVNARSLNQIATLAVRLGDSIEFRAAGADAQQALDALQALHAANFGDPREPEEGQADSHGAAPVRPAGAVAASAGYAAGPAVRFRAALPEVAEIQVDDQAAEKRVLQDALKQAADEIALVEKQTAGNVGGAESEIFGMHRMMLQDPELRDAALHELEERRCNAAAAWRRVIVSTAERYRGLDDDFMRARAADVLDVGARVLRIITGEAPQGPDIAEPSVLLAADLGPSDMARLDVTKVLGIVTEQGGATSHAAILARSMGIPAVAGAAAQIAGVTDGTPVGLDGNTGEVWAPADEHTVQRLRGLRRQWEESLRSEREKAAAPAVTRDGRAVRVHANIGSPADAHAAVRNGAEGVGLFRTEFLFLDRPSAPTEDEQTAAYTEAAQALDGRPVIIRTLDIGGDKPVPYLQQGQAAEANPFLGVRGIRFCLVHEDLFVTQLRALLRAAADHPVQIMFPMVAHPGELRAARTLLEKARAQLLAEGRPCGHDVPVGIMIEVPAAVALADQLAAEADFFSIGTNDLAQYVMAADRGNSAVAALSDALHPAVLRQIQQTVEAGHAAGIHVGMCGELAGAPLAVPLLAAMNLDSLSMSGPAVPRAKEIIRSIDAAALQPLVEQVLELPDAAAVRNLLQQAAGESADRA
ncbi:phosphoenolpyruvate-protein phosphotransferase [Oleidesulfovibrio alaskensis G20]|uniref:Phosphoenolpyruvate-protein phosphotransferase n=1 Tax=Oleidesulfovibrio alaskensis (strain ATCC BAA-1058 / DSM 17464 / G20) TaxID=207559 RepID=Q313B5_OLEA2|nr:phosphoenolpyruvate--protein phosphotransferase [Oleidesulfovibrio alaskensis]ABB37981.1 phosphoenolpyruvate-protein phosphotransferase [Oleidesulfovibrio alaskensis G20]MBG0772875.1 phosphoenolpyruvate--protein phosphotransferase [Oleidesulfovibrio alaskensis]